MIHRLIKSNKLNHESMENSINFVNKQKTRKYQPRFFMVKKSISRVFSFGCFVFLFFYKWGFMVVFLRGSSGMFTLAFFLLLCWKDLHIVVPIKLMLDYLALYWVIQMSRHFSFSDEISTVFLCWKCILFSNDKFNFLVSIKLTCLTLR